VYHTLLPRCGEAASVLLMARELGAVAMRRLYISAASDDCWLPAERSIGRWAS
jgi:hypothetical protein